MAQQADRQQPTLAILAYAPGWRMPMAILFALSRLSLVLIAMMMVIGWFISPPLLVRLVLFLAIMPGLLLYLLRWVFRAEARVQDGQIEVFRRAGLRRTQTLLIDSVQIRQQQVWTLPLPGPGLSLRLHQAAPIRALALEMRRSLGSLTAVLALGQASLSKAAQATLSYAEIKAASYWARWHWPLFKFGIFGLFPLWVLFRLHQNIMFGGLMGQYHLQGPGPWWSSLAYHWIMVTIYLVLYAAFWRCWAELICWLAARWAPGHAVTVRSWAEILLLSLYFLGIPGFIVWRSFA